MAEHEWEAMHARTKAALAAAPTARGVKLNGRMRKRASSRHCIQRPLQTCAFYKLLIEESKNEEAVLRDYVMGIGYCKPITTACRKPQEPISVSDWKPNS